MWIPITTAAVQSRLADAEISAARSVALADGQADPLDEIVSRVVREVRGYVAGNRDNVLAEGDTIPEECEDSALALIRFRLCSRLPVPSLITDARKAEKDEALTFLRDVAAGRIAVVQPISPAVADEQAGGTITPTLCAPRRRFSRRQQDGI